MIVHTMSPAEVVSEAIKDLPAIWNKLKEPIARLQRQAKVDARARDKEHLVEYRSHAGNNWIIVMRATKKVLSIAPFVYYWGGDNKLRAARICDQVFPTISAGTCWNSTSLASTKPPAQCNA